jgi:anti-sigma28 factor (negative regulator of flagellin synthesis)
MRIDPEVVTPPVARNAREPQACATKPGDAASTSASVVKLSTAGTAVSVDGAATATTPARLQAIRAMLDRGDYPVDLDVLASRIVDDELIRAGRS